MSHNITTAPATEAVRRTHPGPIARLGDGLMPRRSLSLTAASIAFSLLLPFGQAAAQDDDVAVLEQFSSIGLGETRASNTITSLEDLPTAIPGTSPERAIDVIPGVNVVTRDPFGFYEFGNDIRLRTFDLEQIAVTVDGVPMGSNSARFGTRVGRVVDNENIQAINVNQGAGDVFVPAYEALGGTIAYTIREPSLDPGAKISWTQGDFESMRMFGRIDTGEILPGLTAFASWSDFSFAPRGLEDVGAEGTRTHVDAVIQYANDWGKFSLQYSYNDRDDFDTVGIQWDRWRALETGEAPIAVSRLGRNDTLEDNEIAPDAAAAIYAANGYREYTPGDFPELSPFRLGDFSDEGRNLGPPTFIIHEDENGDPVGPGEGINAILYDKWRNGRIDNFYRLVYDITRFENLTIEGNAYFQDKQNYGLWGVDRATAEQEVKRGYAYDPDRTDITGADVVRDSAGNPLDEFGNIIALPTAPRPTRDSFQTQREFITALGAWQAEFAVAANLMEIDPNNPVEGRTGRDEEFGGHRLGFFNKAEYTISEDLAVLAGLWYEYDYHTTTRPNYDLENNGAVTAFFDYDQVLFNNYERTWETDTIMYFIAGRYDITEALTISGGFKGLTVDRSIEGILSNQNWRENRRESRDVTYEDTFMPQIGFVYTLNPVVQFFGNYAESISAPDHSNLAVDNFNDTLQPEEAEIVDFGVRLNTDTIQASASVFYIKYDNRLQSVPTTDSASFLAGDDVVANVGGIESYGLESGITWNTPIDGLTLVGSIALQNSEFEEDLLVALVASPDAPDEFYRFEELETPIGTNNYEKFARIGGKSVGNTPDIVLNFETQYRYEEWYFSFYGKYFDEVFVNQLNTELVDSYWVFNANVRWTGQPGSIFEGFTARLAVLNLFDNDIWFARSYEGIDNGQVLSDRGRTVTVTLEANF